MKQRYFRFIETQQQEDGTTSFIVLAYKADQKVEAKQKFYETMKFVVASDLPFHSAELYDSDRQGNILYGDNQ